ncbi:hypothetical protein B9Q01_10630 [Candidatus Marsarchaeota G1 archaeon OSP_D]|jgi:hypothetical protein|uniref:Uncharacterized protein n=1 Tax=Candidatus Marsarchaeota G1 archaeon OSP_D TaxID=1978155 RepID=A0A2R6A5Q6_9ARCH|nr:MAG: hypothetical protein B9Q01_10630 [Candidatus Marsarchaeota G1 archaeon OSP_D]
MRVVLNVVQEGKVILSESEECEDFMDCMVTYMDLLTRYGKELGYCYGLQPRFKVNCTHGYVEIKK